VDLPAAGLTFWGLEAYVRRRPLALSVWFSLAALAKETAVLVPLALLLWKFGFRFWAKRWIKASRLSVDRREAIDGERVLPLCPPFGSRGNSQSSQSSPAELVNFRPLCGLDLPESRASYVDGGLLVAVLALVGWYAYHYARTGFVFGNPEFFRYNVQGTLHLLRIFLALLLRIWQLVGYLGLYVLTLACVVAMKYAPVTDRWMGTGVVDGGSATAHGREATAEGVERPRIPIPVQLAFLAITVVYLLALSVLGGAVLARYMLPIIPLMILICASTIWRRLQPWAAALGIVAFGFVLSLFINPPYGFSPEDNLAYRDYILLHERAEAFIQEHYPRAQVLTAWPASDELTHPYLGYVVKGMRVVRIEDFTAEQLLSAADATSRFDVALVFSTKYQPESSMLDRWRKWQEWKARYFGYHVDLSPEAAASVIGGNLVYVERRRGQWIGVIQVERIEEATRRQAICFENAVRCKSLLAR
jgi:hypothetical protein